VASPAQQAFAEAVFSGDYTILGYGGAIRGGKSYGAIAILVTLCKVFPGSRWAIVRSDLPTIRRNVLPTFNKVRALTNGFVGEVNQSTWTAQCSNGSEIILFPESISPDPELERWKGLEVNGFLLEEANELSVKSYGKAIERAGAWIIPPTQQRPTPTQPPPLILCTFNPSAGWVRETFYDPWRNGTIKAPFFFQPATIEDNPYLPQSYKDNLRTMPAADYKRFVEGDWDVLAGRYFDELNKVSHFAPAFDKTDWGTWNIPDWWEQWGSYDWGFAHHAVACAFAKDGDGQMYLVDSRWMQRLSDDEMAQEIVKSLPKKALSEIHAGHDCWARRLAHGGTAPTVAEVFAAHDIALVKAAIDRVPGWNTLRRALTMRGLSEGQSPRLVFCDTPGNRKLFEQLSALEYDEIHGEDVSKKKAEEKGVGDDGADACLSGATMVHTDTGFRRIDSLLGSSGKCLTPLGWQRYIAVRKTHDRALLLRVTLDDGTAIEATADHEVLTPAGWRCINDLSLGDSWVRLANGAQPIAAGVPGAPLLAERGRVLSTADALAAPGSVRGQLWSDTGRASDTSPRRESSEQRAGELGADDAQVARATSLDTGARGAVGGSHRDDTGQGGGVASLSRRAFVAFAERLTGVGATGEGAPRVPVLRHEISVEAGMGTLLFKRLQVDGTPSSGTGQRDGPVSGVQHAVYVESVRSADDVLEVLRAGDARVVSIEPVGFAATYNMEVEAAHCFAVQGGLVVHNCRYGIATRFPNATEPVAHKGPWVQGHDPQALVPFIDMTQHDEVGDSGLSSWGF